MENLMNSQNPETETIEVQDVENQVEQLLVEVEDLSNFESRGACMGDDPGDNND